MGVQDMLCLYDNELSVANVATIIVFEKIEFEEFKD
jgi:hypothetical protein